MFNQFSAAAVSGPISPRWTTGKCPAALCKTITISCQNREHFIGWARWTVETLASNESGSKERGIEFAYTFGCDVFELLTRN